MTEQLIKKYDGLINKIASRFYGVPVEDLKQVGVIGLLKAFNNYIDSANTKFSTYAYDYIFGEMYQLCQNNKPLKVNKETLKMVKEIEKVREFLTHKLNRYPKINEISLFLEVDEKVVSDALLSERELLSLDESFADKETPLYEIITKEEIISLDDQILIDETISLLPSPEKEIIRARYFEDKSQSEIASNLGLTQVMVSRLEKKSLNLMRNYITN